MILRMYELAAADMERLAGWPAEAGQQAGAIRAPWPEDRLAIELVVAPADARGRQLTDQERRSTVRRLIPWLARKLILPEGTGGPALVLRLDGRLQPGSILEAMRHLDPIHTSLFSFTGGKRLAATAPFPATTLMMLANGDVLADLAGNNALALGEQVRLRAFAVPHEVAPQLLDTARLDSEQWPALLAETRLLIAPAASLQSVFLVGPLSAEELRARLSEAPGH